MAFSDQLSHLLNHALHTSFQSSFVSGIDDSWQIPVLDVAENAQQKHITQQHLVLKFYEIALVKNQPCILSETATKQWQSRQKWACHNGEVDFTYLEEHFGHAMVPVADCQIKHYNSQLKEEMQFSKYLHYWKALIADNYEHQKQGNLYLKDWHCTRDFPTYNAYQTPECLSSDWLNEFWSTRTDAYDDYRFVYMGPKGTWTPLHLDVFHSYSWSANICGQKKWILFPPEEEEHLKDSRRQLVYDVQSPVDPQNFPNYDKIKHRFEVLQNPGEIIFIPSRWFHQVINLEDTISINHNWFNGFNIDIIWQSLCKALKEVEAEIEDCKSMEGWQQQCQLLLRATHGMDFEEFHHLLCTIGKARLLRLNKIYSQSPTDSGDWELAHINFDLKKIRHVFQCMLNAEENVNSAVSLELYNEIRDHLEETDQ